MSGVPLAATTLIMRKAWPLLLSLAACSSESAPSSDENPFLADLSNSGKEDSAYMNPDGIEVEIDLEGDVEGPAYKLKEGPIEIGQFALTYFRKQEKMYIESLAEDGTAAGRAEWLVNGTWYAADRIPAGSTLKHWRLRGLNTVLLFDHATGVNVGTKFTAKVPVNPFTVFADAGESCADDNDHISLGQDVYWYRWSPGTACSARTQDIDVTVSKKFSSTTSSVYPEYDQLTADKKVTFVVLYGQVGDGAITDSDWGVISAKQYGTWLVQAGFKSVTAPLGKRYEKKLTNGVLAQIDIYGPREFSGLGDYAHVDNFQKALSEHEVVAYSGHSMLGASDFWARMQYPANYQIFLYGGCLGYEYYVKPILHGKGDSWDKLDVVSSIVEVSASAPVAGPAIAKIIYGVEHGGSSSWRDILVTVRDNVGDSTFGVSGVRDNCFTPNGTRCN